MSEVALVFLILFVTVILFVSDKLALDLVGLMALLALYLSGLVTINEALAGFSNPVVVTLAALFVVGGALFRTGVAASLGDWLSQKGGSNPTRLIALTMILSALLSAFMSSTGTVAILIPAVLGVSQSTRIPVQRLLMPLSAGCLIGGMLTLVGTAPNLVVQEALMEAGLERFNFFSFTPMGLIILGVSIVYMNFVGPRLLKGNVDKNSEETNLTTHQLAGEYDLKHHLRRLRILEESPLVGRCLRDSGLREDFHLNLLGFQQEKEVDPLHQAVADHTLRPGQILYLHGEEQDLEKVVRDLSLEQLPDLQSYTDVNARGGLAEVLLTPRSGLLGRTLTTSRFQDRYRVNVIAGKRRGVLLEDLPHQRFKFGDTLLVAGSFRALANLRSERFNFVVTGMPSENPVEDFRHNRAWVAVLLTLAMLGLMTFSSVPSVMVVLMVAVAALLTGCLSTEDAYRSVSWQSLILIATMLPMASALEKTGGVTLVAEFLSNNLGTYGPQFTMIGLFLLTSIFSQFISNTATTVIVTPIAMVAAEQAQVAPYSFLMTVAVAASAAFATPVASPVNMLVMSPGRYKFTDFVKVGVPLQLVVMILSVLLLPRLFPF